MARNTKTVEADATAAVAANVNEEIISEYRSADRAGKAKIRAALEAAMDAAVGAFDMAGALAARNTLLACKENGGPAKSEVDYQAVVARRIEALRLAADNLENGVSVPSGFPEGFRYVRSEVELSTEDAEAIAAEAKSIAETKLVRRVSSGERHSIADVVERAFEGATKGTTLKVSEIVRRGRTDEYAPSAGAVAAFLERNAEKGIVGYVVNPRTDNSPWSLTLAD